MTIRIFRPALIVAAVFAMLACTNQPRSTGEKVDDSTIATRVKIELAKTDGLADASVNVEAYKGVVQLSGFVHPASTRERALAAAAKAEGVTSVRDGLVVTDERRTLGNFIDDKALKAKINLKITDVTNVATNVSVVNHVRNGEVILAGFVNNAETRGEVLSAVRGIRGVTRVYDKLLLRF